MLRGREFCFEGGDGFVVGERELARRRTSAGRRRRKGGRARVGNVAGGRIGEGRRWGEDEAVAEV